MWKGNYFVEKSWLGEAQRWKSERNALVDIDDNPATVVTPDTTVLDALSGRISPSCSQFEGKTGKREGRAGSNLGSLSAVLDQTFIYRR